MVAIVLCGFAICLTAHPPLCMGCEEGAVAGAQGNPRWPSSWPLGSTCPMSCRPTSSTRCARLPPSAPLAQAHIADVHMRGRWVSSQPCRQLDRSPGHAHYHSYLEPYPASHKPTPPFPPSRRWRKHPTPPLSTALHLACTCAARMPVFGSRLPLRQFPGRIVHYRFPDSWSASHRLKCHSAV